MKGILPLKCHVCKTEFAIELGKGRLCDNCKKPTCNRHLSKHGVRENTLYVCTTCLSKSMSM